MINEYFTSNMIYTQRVFARVIYFINGILPSWLTFRLSMSCCSSTLSHTWQSPVVITIPPINELMQKYFVLCMEFSLRD